MKSGDENPDSIFVSVLILPREMEELKKQKQVQQP